VKRSHINDPVWVEIHIRIETTQGISLYSCLHLKLAKTPCLSFYLVCFFLQQNWRTRWWNRFFSEMAGEEFGGKVAQIM
jgi:hypothetical protein